MSTIHKKRGHNKSVLRAGDRAEHYTVLAVRQMFASDLPWGVSREGSGREADVIAHFQEHEAALNYAEWKSNEKNH